MVALLEGPRAGGLKIYFGKLTLVFAWRRGFPGFVRFGWDEGCGQGRGRRLQTTYDFLSVGSGLSQGRLGQLEGARLQLINTISQGVRRFLGGKDAGSSRSLFSDRSGVAGVYPSLPMLLKVFIKDELASVL
jgi:hypothetical protein